MAQETKLATETRYSEMIAQEIHIAKLQRQKLQQQTDWQGFLESEWKQLDQYNKLFGTPRRHQKGMTILPWVRTYLYKNTKGEIGKDATKSRGTYNGGPRYCDKSTLAETYAACVEQPIQQLTYDIAVATNLVCKGYKVGNTFAEAPAPHFKFYATR